MNSYFDIYLDNDNLLKHKYKTALEIREDCIYILDTNVLLLPYTVGSKELEIIKRVYEKLKKESRLLIPSQVVKEFAKNRPNKLSEMNQAINEYSSRLSISSFPKYKMLVDMDEYKEIENAYNELSNSLKLYKKAIKKMSEYIHGINWNDPISILYSSIIENEMILDYEWNYEKLQKELEERHKYNIPPANKDKGKPDKGIGDYIIWKDILEAGKEQKKDIIFVTGDEKADWYHQSGGAKLYPRYELIYEFKNYTDGKNVAFISLSNLIEINSDNNDEDKKKIDEIKRVEIRKEKLSLRELKKRALEKYQYQCSICKKSLDENIAAIHFNRLAEDEKRDIDNVLVLCQECNAQIRNGRFDFNKLEVIEEFSKFNENL